MPKDGIDADAGDEVAVGLEGHVGHGPSLESRSEPHLFRISMEEGNGVPQVAFRSAGSHSRVGKRFARSFPFTLKTMP